MAKFDIDYELGGSINGSALAGSGKGLADFATGTYELEVSFETVPLHWDPAFILLMTCDCFMGVSAREEGGASNIFTLSKGDHNMQWGRVGAIYDGHDHEVGSFRSLSVCHPNGNRVVSRSQVVSAQFRLRIGEEVTQIVTPVNGVMMPYRDDMVLVTMPYSFRTNAGNYHGYTFFPYMTQSKKTLAGFQALAMDSIEFKREKRPPRGETVRFHVGSTVRGLELKR